MLIPYGIPGESEGVLGVSIPHRAGRVLTQRVLAPCALAGAGAGAYPGLFQMAMPTPTDEGAFEREAGACLILIISRLRQPCCGSGSVSHPEPVPPTLQPPWQRAWTQALCWGRGPR